MPAITYAAQNAFVALMQILIDRGANVNAVNKVSARGASSVSPLAVSLVSHAAPHLDHTPTHPPTDPPTHPPTHVLQFGRSALYMAGAMGSFDAALALKAGGAEVTPLTAHLPHHRPPLLHPASLTTSPPLP